MRLDGGIERSRVGVSRRAGKLFLGELGAKDGEFGKEEFPLDSWRLGVVEDGPDGNEILELTTSLLNDTVLTTEDDTHSGQVADFSLTHDKRVCSEYWALLD